MERDRLNLLPEDTCRRIYNQTKCFYGRISTGREDVGFQILLGPPFKEAPILFLGYQPGKGCKTPLEERAYGSEDRWPDVPEYVTECWPLAKCMRRIFDANFLSRCVALNAIFVRSDSVSVYYRDFCARVRKEINQFCLPRVNEIVEAVHPKKIVAVGIGTLSLFDKRAYPCLKGANGRVLMKAGKIAGRDAIGVLHLTGAHISATDRAHIDSYLRAFGNSN
jgi:hypothetical protein